MMEKEEAGSRMSLPLSKRQWAAVTANLFPIWEQCNDLQLFERLCG